ncbi:twin-arginine translocation signal domain-containing protein [Halorubrum sp. ASP1]|nr:twin-arginine translocation signal domain-containing protein [Halorubrum sp. ASP1]
MDIRPLILGCRSCVQGPHTGRVVPPYIISDWELLGSMERRNFLKGTAIVSVGGLTSLAGCSGGSPSSSVVTNEFDSITVESSRLENTEMFGTEVVNALVTVKNSSNEAIEVGLNITLYDGDTIVASDEATVDETIPANTSKEISEAHEGRMDNVSRYEISLTEPEGLF